MGKEKKGALPVFSSLQSGEEATEGGREEVERRIKKKDRGGGKEKEGQTEGST